MNSATFVQDYYALFDSVRKVKNYRTAFPFLMVAAKNGHPHAQNLVGYPRPGLGILAAIFF
jgi:hypothetical protein